MLNERQGFKHYYGVLDKVSNTTVGYSPSNHSLHFCHERQMGTTHEHPAIDNQCQISNKSNHIRPNVKVGTITKSFSPSNHADDSNEVTSTHLSTLTNQKAQFSLYAQDCARIIIFQGSLLWKGLTMEIKKREEFFFFKQKYF